MAGSVTPIMTPHGCPGKTDILNSPKIIRYFLRTEASNDEVAWFQICLAMIRCAGGERTDPVERVRGEARVNRHDVEAGFVHRTGYLHASAVNGNSFSSARASRHVG